MWKYLGQGLNLSHAATWAIAMTILDPLPAAPLRNSIQFINYLPSMIHKTLGHTKTTRSLQPAEWGEVQIGKDATGYCLLSRLKETPDPTDGSKARVTPAGSQERTSCMKEGLDPAMLCTRSLFLWGVRAVVSQRDSQELFPYFFFFFLLFRAVLAAYGGSQARGLIRRATPASLHHSHSNVGSEPHLRPTPQLTATPDPPTH